MSAATVQPAPPRPRLTARWNRHTLALGAAFVAMWYAAAAQSNGAVYLLAFACAGTALLSWLHARANLRGIEILPGDLVTDVNTGLCRVPLRVTARSARAACGVEIAAAGARSSVFIGRLEPGVPFRAELVVPAAQFEAPAQAALLVRSLYPLGFFTAGLRLPLARSSKVMPRPEGDLPLPAPEKIDAPSTLDAAAASRAVGGNDDFAGVRAWQPGDSPRHIDWKAVARERPLMTKQWTGGADEAVMLDWDAVPLETGAKARQIARWAHDCESRGLRYGMRLPGRAITAGGGPAHLRRCLEALGELSGGGLTGAEHGGRVRIPFVHETAATASRAPLWMTGAALALTLPPMIGEVSAAAMLALLVAVAMRWRGGAWCSPLARVALVVFGAGLVYATEPEYRSMEAATALLLVFVGGKVVESRSPRDFQVLGLLAWFLCMCALSLEQSLLWSLYTAGVFLFIATALVSLRQGAGRWRSSARAAAALTAQAAPVMVLMFLFFPRGNEDFVARLARRNAGRSGLSANLDPGSVAAVALSDKVAFRAQLAGGRSLAPRERYWRCLVLWDCNGLSWRRGRGSSHVSGRWPPRDTLVRQTITIEPHGNLWLPALDHPVEVVADAAGTTMGDDDTVISQDRVENPRRFVVTSSVAPSPAPSGEAQRARALHVASNVGADVRNLAASFRQAGGDDDARVVRAALDHLRAQGFKYTLTPGDYGADGLEDFLLRRRLGFCEHFSAGFGTLMRLAGVPARVVVGFLGGEFSERGGYWIMRQSDAHAWTEVWLPASGWTRIDPTAELNPERLTTDLETSLAGADSPFALNRRTWWWRAWTETRLLWDRLDYEWYNRVVSADEQAQSDALSALGLGEARRGVLLALLAGGVLLCALGVFLWLRRAARHPDPAARLWLEVCRRLARAGLARRPGEGAGDFAARAALVFPNAAASLRVISERYNEVRYGCGLRTVAELKLAVTQLPALTKRQTSSSSAS